MRTRTKAQQEASRINGAKSRGPVTPEGKAISSRNAEKHGIFSDIFVDGEDAARYVAKLDRMVAEFQPSSEAEFDTVENLTCAYWRQRRTWAFMAQCLNNEIRTQTAASPEVAAMKPSERAAIGFRRLADESSSLELSRRYDAGMERQYYRALHSLRDRKPGEKNCETNLTTDQLPLFE